MAWWRRGVLRRRFVPLGAVAAILVTTVGVLSASAVTPPTATLSAFTTTNGTNAQTGAFSVPVNAIPGAAFSPQGASASTGIQSVSLGRISLGRISLGRISLGRISLGRIALKNASLGRIAVGEAALNGMLLSDIPITYPSGCGGAACTNWSGVLAGSAYAFTPLQSVTLLQVLQDPVASVRFNTLSLADIDFGRTALGSISAAAIALANVPLSKLALPSRYPGTTALAQWCGVLSAVAVSCANDLGVNPAVPVPSDDAITLLSLGLMGVDLDQLPLDDIILTGLDPLVLGDSPLGVNTLGATNLQASSLGRISLGRINLANTSLGRISLGRINLAGSALGAVSLGRISLAGTALGSISLGRIDLSKTSLGRISLGRINLAGSALGDIRLGGINLATSALGTISLGRIDFSKTSLGGISLGRIDFSKTSLGRISLGRIDLSKTALGTISLGRINLAQSDLGTISLGRISLANTSLGRISLGQISSLSSVVTCAPADGSAPGSGFDCTNVAATLADVPSAYLIGNLRNLAANLLAGPAGLDAFNAETLRELVAGIAPIDPNNLLAADPARDVQLAALVATLTAGATDIPLSATLTEFLGALASTDAAFMVTLADLTNALTSTDAASVTLADLTNALASTDAAFNVTLADLMNALAPTDVALSVKLAELLGGGLRSSTDAAFTVPLAELVGALAPTDPALAFTLAELLGALKNAQDPAFDTTVSELLALVALTDPAFGEDLAHYLSAIADGSGITLEDVLLGLLGVGDLPWEQLNLGAVPLQDKASPAPVPVGYAASIGVDDGGNGPQTVTLQAQVPDDFLYVPHSTLVDGAPGSEPVASNPGTGPLLTWTVSGLSSGPHNVTFSLYAGLSLGDSRVSASAGLLPTSLGTPIVTTTRVLADGSAYYPNAPVPLNADTLYLGHISATGPSNSNFFRLTVAGGTRASIRLGNLPADYDLVLYDLDTPKSLRQSPSRSVVPVEDPQLSLATLTDTLAPETLQDLALVSGKRVYGVSAKRGFDDETIDTGALPAGDYLLQVAGYNGASSPLPYSLRARLFDEPAASCPRDATAFASRFAFPDAVAPTSALTAPNLPVDTLVLVNPDRLAKTWGDVSTLWTQLDQFVGAYHKARVIRLDDANNPHGILGAYDAWDRDPCSVDRANDVVRAIGQILDDALVVDPGVRYITVLGADDQIPMARLRDATRVANEHGRAADFAGQANALVGSLSAGMILSDDAYTSARPLAVGGRELFVPEQSVGRLVESPSQIGSALDYFRTQGGVLPSSSTSLTTGYNFLTDGAQSVEASLDANGRTGQTLINDTWTRGDLCNRLLGFASASATVPACSAADAAPVVPDVAAINAHFDEQNALPAIGNTNKSQADLFTVQDVRNAPLRAGVPALRGRLLFSMGCHAGLNLPDKIGLVGSTDDWVETFADQGALWVANTGFGYGDTDTVALSEKLMALFADQLDRSSTIGQALATAKQRYAAGLAVVSPYDEKALMESTFYGLPMWTLPSPKLGPAPTTTPGLSVPADIAGLRAADVSQTLIDGGTSGSGSGQFRLVVTPGSNSLLDGHYQIAGNTQTAPRRPVQPRVELDVSPDPARDAALGGLVAKGALITSLQSKDIAGFKPDYFRPTVDDARNETNQDVGDAPFPAGLQSLTTFGGGSVPTQRLVLVPGQFRPTPGLAIPGRGNERLFTQLGARVYYAPSSDPDNIAPAILASSATVSASTVTVTATVNDSGTGSTGVKRVFALFTQSGLWIPVELHQVGNALGDGSTTWAGTAATEIPNAPVDYYLQAVDGSGNVGSTSSKGAFFNAQNLAQQGPLRFSFTSTVAPGSNGWWRGPVTVTVRPPTLTRLLNITTTVTDANGIQTQLTPQIGPVTFTLSADGIYTIESSQSNQQTSRVQVLIDHLAPLPYIGYPSGGGPNANGWSSTNPLPVSIVPLDPSSSGSGVNTVIYSATGANLIAQKSVPEPAVGAPPITESFTHDGQTAVLVRGTDRAGNTTLTAGMFPVWIDSVAPTATIVANPPKNAAGWHKDVPILTITGADAAPGTGPGQVASGVAKITYRVNGGNLVEVAGNTANPAVSEGQNVVTFTAIDFADNESQVYSVNVNVDMTLPETTATVTTENAAGWARTNPNVAFAATDPVGPDGKAGSGPASITYSATADPAKGGATVASTTTAGASANYTLTQEGITTFAFYATDNAGNPEVPNTRVVRLDRTPPAITCPVSDGVWRNANVSLACSAVDPMSGLLDPSGDAHFNLVTNLPAGQESATVATDSRVVPDIAGNQATAGPIVNNKIDRKPPVISLSITATNAAAPIGPSPVPVYLLNQTAKVTFSCTDGGSGVQSCLGKDDTTAKLTNAALNTSAVGLHTFTVTTVDKVGNAATQSLSYRVIYNICLSYDPNASKTVGSTVNIVVKLCNAAGTNVSASTIQLTAVEVSTGGVLLTPVPNGSGGLVFSYTPNDRTYTFGLKTDSRYKKYPLKTWLSFRVSSDPQTPAPTGSQTTDLTYLNKLYRGYITLK